LSGDQWKNRLSQLQNENQMLLSRLNSRGPAAPMAKSTAAPTGVPATRGNTEKYNREITGLKQKLEGKNG